MTTFKTVAKREVYYIREKGHYWRPASAGHTDKIERAGQYSKANAYSIIAGIDKEKGVSIEQHIIRRIEKRGK